MPFKSQIHIDVALTNMSKMQRNPEYIADKVLPIVSVAKDSDKYFIYGTENYNLENARRNPRDPAAEVDYSISNDSYTCDRFALRDFITDDEIKNADAPLDPKGDAAVMLTERLLLRREYDAAAYVFNTTTMTGYTGALSGTTQWSHADSKPITAIETQRGNIIKRTGVKPNKLILGYEVFAALKSNPQILDAIKYTQTGIVTKELLAALFEVDEIIVGSAAYNSAKPGQTSSLGYVWGKYALLAHVAPRPGVRTLSLGYTFESMARTVKTYQVPGMEGEYVEVEEKRDQKLIAPAAGYLFSAAVA